MSRYLWGYGQGANVTLTTGAGVELTGGKSFSEGSWCEPEVVNCKLVRKVVGIIWYQDFCHQMAEILYQLQATVKRTLNFACSMFRTFIQSTGDLDLIFLGLHLSANNQEFPSWCPNFLDVDYDAFNSRQVAYFSGQDIRYRYGRQCRRWSATGESSLQPQSFQFEEKVMKVPGKMIGIIRGSARSTICFMATVTFNVSLCCSSRSSTSSSKDSIDLLFAIYCLWI